MDAEGVLEVEDSEGFGPDFFACLEETRTFMSAEMDTNLFVAAFDENLLR